MPVRVLVMGLMVLLALLLKTTVLPTVAVSGYRPDALLLVVVSVALLEGPDSGLRLGFAAGLTQDLVSGGAALVGVGAIVGMATGYAAGRLKPFIVSAPRAGAVVAAGALVAAATLLTGLAGRFFGTYAVAVPTVVNATIIVGLYSAVFAPVAIPAVQWVMRQFPPVPTG